MCKGTAASAAIGIRNWLNNAKQKATNAERVQESVAHLYYHIDYQDPNSGVPHFSEHAPNT